MQDFKRILVGLFSLFVAVGLLAMFGMLVWSFHLAKDFTGRYETANFHRHFWNFFDIGAGLCLLGCLGLSAALKSRIAACAGVFAFVLSFVLLIVLMASVDFEGWTGAAAYMLITVVFVGGVLLLAGAGIKWLWGKFQTRQSAP
jgi:peptidoglycan/LPS O-acetylase OafA/YrhL